MTDLFIAVLVVFFVGAIAVSIALFCSFRKMEGFDLVQGKLPNANPSAVDELAFLKLTNEWKEES